jgi:hypothetical protein
MADGPGPINYPQLFADAMLVGSMRRMVEKVADAGARQALEHGMTAAQEAMQKHAGSDVTIRAAATAGGAPSGGGIGNPGHRE